MATPTLIVIDVQRAFDEPSWGERNNPDAERNVARAIDAWRERGAPLIHVRHESEGLFAPGSESAEFKPEARPRGEEPVLTKNVNSAFIGSRVFETRSKRWFHENSMSASSPSTSCSRCR